MPAGGPVDSEEDDSNHADPRENEGIENRMEETN